MKKDTSNTSDSSNRNKKTGNDKIHEKWEKIEKIMEMTKDSDYKRFLIVPLEDWNPYLLSPKRKELLKIIRKKKIGSETQLAKIVHRKRPNVVADLKLLEHYGLVKLERNGNKIIPKPEKTQIIII